MKRAVLPFPRQKCWQNAIAGLFVALFALSVALMAIGVRLRADAATAKIMSGYALAKCTLVAAQVVNCPLGGFVPVWKRAETGSSVLQDPFSSADTMQLAQVRLDDYPIGANMTYDCMCNTYYVDPFPVINCNFVDACMLNVPMIQYMHTVGLPFGYSGDTLVSIGAILLVCVVLGIIFLLAGNGFCNWCCCCMMHPAKDDIYTMDTSSND